MTDNRWFGWALLLFLAIGAFGSFLYAAARCVDEWPGPRPGRKLHLVERDPRPSMIMEELV